VNVIQLNVDILHLLVDLFVVLQHFCSICPR
jgi:hypothetical protein